jgi:hypothetical protein
LRGWRARLRNFAGFGFLGLIGDLGSGQKSVHSPLSGEGAGELALILLLLLVAMAKSKVLAIDESAAAWASRAKATRAGPTDLVARILRRTAEPWRRHGDNTDIIDRRPPQIANSAKIFPLVLNQF